MAQIDVVVGDLHYLIPNLVYVSLIIIIIQCDAHHGHKLELLTEIFVRIN